MIVKVIVDINTKSADKPYSYIVPADIEDEIQVGCKVEFPFGKTNKTKNGYVVEIKHENDLNEIKLKSIYGIVQKAIQIDSRSINIANFIKNRYGSTMSKALQVVLPVKTKVKTNKVFEELNSLNQDVKDIELNDEQKRAVNSFLSTESNKCLLHGVTGSGKTQVFIEIAKKIIEDGKQVIILIPEIALTYQTVSRFFSIFGERIGILNSRLSNGEKYEYMKRAREGKIDIVIGPRSALFTPFENLGCIIIDEEHESSYKSDKSPKYDARDVAEFISANEDVKLLLASATPSIRSYYLAKEGIYKLIELKSRINNIKLPKVEIVDMKQEVLDGNMGIFAKKSIDTIQKTLDDGHQVLIFVSRRGYSNYISCATCGEPINCKNCDVSYTYHSETDSLRCHYCDRNIALPKTCKNCGGKNLIKIGYGTQKVEEELKRLYPDYKVLRMDKDTTKTKYSYEKILKKFHYKQADILVGTQMIIKGHDFYGVALVVILNIDATLNLPSYMANEEVFQAIVQCSGRSGRGKDSGLAIIQTFEPNNNIINFAKNNDYLSYYENEIAYRKLLDYPPVDVLLKISMADTYESRLISLMNRIKSYLVNAQKDGMIILGPSNEIIYRVNNVFRSNIYIKGDEKIINYSIRVCEYIRSNDKKCMNAIITYDINPFT